MAKKRPATPASPTDEWGIYDPAKAGMQALYNRLGRPVIRASAAGERRKRRGASRPDRPADGVGLAIQEAQRRASQLAAAKPAVAPPTGAPAAKAANQAGRTTAIKARKSRKTASPVEGEPTPRRTRRTPRERDGATPTAAAPERAEAQALTPATPPAPPAPPAPAVPPPSPRRPRGPVPLAAWAHAVSDTARPEPKRGEAKGLWRGIFRIPSEVALVEYGRGCRIHRLVIEATIEPVIDPF